MQPCYLLLADNICMLFPPCVGNTYLSMILTFVARTLKHWNLLIIVIGQLDLSDTIWLENSHSTKVSNLPVRDYISLFFASKLSLVKYYFFPRFYADWSKSRSLWTAIHTNIYAHTPNTIMTIYVVQCLYTSGKLSKHQQRSFMNIWQDDLFQLTLWLCLFMDY